jgi:hypothetical protein
MSPEFFQPRGLFCLVMTWKPESPALYEEIDLTSTISSNVSNTNPSMRQNSKTPPVPRTAILNFLKPQLSYFQS